MSEQIQKPLNPTQQAQLLARYMLNQVLDIKAQGAFGGLSKDVVPYLMDHFILINDLKTSSVNEEFRHAYSDYSFVVMPINKAFEAYIAGIFSRIFGFTISKKRTETVGFLP